MKAGMNMQGNGLGSRQRGAALVIGLILLVVITVLAVSGMNTATTELAMARNDQNSENAFQAAETGIEAVLALPDFDPDTPITVTQTMNGGRERVQAALQFVAETIPSDDDAYSLGEDSGISAYHFRIDSTAESLRLPGSNTDRDASALHTQAFYIIGPESPEQFGN
jgi:type IV pilus assembly protein PilX